jgi:hypothetical protein
MHEFETFVYLDMEKTGSSFVLKLLRLFCIEAPLRRNRHAGMGANHDASKFYFMTARGPLDAYLSLYSFGCQAQGKVRQQLGRNALADLYDGTRAGFSAWLALVLAPENAAVLNRKFLAAGGGRVVPLMGIQSWRYLRLALADADACLARCSSRDDVRAAFASGKLPDFVARQETLAADLRTLLETDLRHAFGDRPGALRFIETGRRINTSHRIDAGGAPFVLEPALDRLLREREWFLFEVLAQPGA